jgi:hypothetical protein
VGQKDLPVVVNQGKGNKKTSKGFSQPLRIPRRSPTSSEKSDDGDGNDGYSFGNMMSMMMMQNRFRQRTEGAAVSEGSRVTGAGVRASSQGDGNCT